MLLLQLVTTCLVQVHLFYKYIDIEPQYVD